MKSAIAILTWNRRRALQDCLKSFTEHLGPLGQVGPTAIFEDCGHRDDTRALLKRLMGSESLAESRVDERYRAQIAKLEQLTTFFGTVNAGVAVNSNRAIRWFMEMTDADCLFLCNDDLLATGDFVQQYTSAAKGSGIHHFCFCGIDAPEYETTPCQVNGVNLRLLQRLTGSMMFMSRELVNAIGYYDTRFGLFGNEHCHWTTRAGVSGLVQVNDRAAIGVDIVEPSLKQQTVPSTMTGPALAAASQVADRAARSVDLVNDGIYVPFSNGLDGRVGGIGNQTGFDTRSLPIGTIDLRVLQA